MRLSFTIFPTAILLLVIGVASCEKPESRNDRLGDADPDSEEPGGLSFLPGVISKEKEDRNSKAPAFPVDRILRDNKGRDLDATVIGRSSLKLTVIRRIDEARLDVPIDSLSVEDQAWARSLDFQAAPLKVKSKGEMAEEIEEPPYVKSRREQILRLEERVQRLESESKVSDNEILKRTHRTQIKNSKDEIAKLKADIDIYRPREKGN